MLWPRADRRVSRTRGATPGKRLQAPCWVLLDNLAPESTQENLCGAQWCHDDVQARWEDFGQWQSPPVLLTD